ncbi:hypothetical protein [Catellatospora methionotrophica]|uniref:hypothetical protein n=1 Tax=Catellatospora methionotrophica TaxID=121620 RepID=UPI00140B2D38|nr:hypothetical protein [Catellatospora methionotrophica]
MSRFCDDCSALRAELTRMERELRRLQQAEAWLRERFTGLITAVVAIHELIRSEVERPTMGRAVLFQQVTQRIETAILDAERR